MILVRIWSLGLEGHANQARHTTVTIHQKKVSVADLPVRIPLKKFVSTLILNEWLDNNPESRGQFKM